MILINSAAYVSPEFQAEIGIVPPCMLPIGNKKLIELQVEELRKLFPEEIITLSIPESYQLAINEEKLIKTLGITIEPVPDEFSLADSILYVLNLQSEKDFRCVRIFHGDTLIRDLPTDSDDAIAIVKHAQGYNWHKEYLESGETYIWSGYFSFSSRLGLIRSLATSKGDFVKAVQEYRKHIPMALKEVNEWFDCGYINPFFEARAKITTQRSFNSLVIEGGVVTKSSHKAEKMAAEINWFNAIPATLKKFRPQFIEHGTLDNGYPYYSIEFLSLLPLNELYVHGRNPLAFWQTIFGLVREYFKISVTAIGFSEADKQSIASSSERLYQNKTVSRLADFIKVEKIDADLPIKYEGKNLGSINEIAKNCIEKTLKLPCVPTVMHGDLCFSNMLFDTRGRRLKLIDPRGIDEDNQLTILGNQTYDLAKLAHSVIGMYDFIIAGRYQIVEVDGAEAVVFDIDERLASIQNAFLATDFIEGISVKQAMPAVVLLFLSMLPLHDDRPDRQRAMLLNAFRLYRDFVIEG